MINSLYNFLVLACRVISFVGPSFLTVSLLSKDSNMITIWAFIIPAAVSIGWSNENKRN